MGKSAYLYMVSNFRGVHFIVTQDTELIIIRSSIHLFSKNEASKKSG